MGGIVSITIPFFAVVVLGYIAARRNFISAEGVNGINSFVFYFALPALLFAGMAGAPVEKLLGEKWFIAAHIIAGLALFAVGWIGAMLLPGVGRQERAIVGLGAAYGNIGFMGVALGVQLLGQWAAVPLALMVLADIGFFIPLAGILIVAANEHDSGNGNSIGGIIRKSMLSLGRNPLIIAIVAGAVVAVAGIEMPGWLSSLLDLLGKAAAPAAMFALGAVLAGRPLGGAVATSALVGVLKLGVHPLVVWLVMGVFAISHEWRMAATLGAAMPVAAGLFVIAKEYGAMPVRASTMVLVSTALSLLSVTAVIYLM